MPATPDKEKNMPDIFLLSLGCPRNLVDSEVLAGKLKKQGFRVFHEFKKHSIAIINTCGFIDDAKNESIDSILELSQLKKKGSVSRLIVSGCLSQRYAKDLMRQFEEVDALFGSSSFMSIPEYLPEIINGEKVVVIDESCEFLYSHDTPRSILTPRHSVYVKIQEGCMNFCSYCVIPKIRGPFRSRTMDSVYEEVSHFKKAGAKEINLIGQDTTLYGFDRYKKLMLPALLKRLTPLMKSRWIRILYTHPAHYSDELIEIVKDEPAICKYLDLPIQHISDKILKTMNRSVGRREIVLLLDKLRKKIPGVALRTTVMVGFPGETDEDFKELEDFVKEIQFERLGAFVYSQEEGTPAYDLPGQVPQKDKDKRLGRIMELQKRVSEANNRRLLGRTLKVIIDERDGSQPDRFIGRTEYDAPEVDGAVYVKSDKALKKGDFADVKIYDTLEYDLVGTHEYRK